MDEVNACSDKIPKLIEELIDGNQAAVESLAKEISVLEGKADNGEECRSCQNADAALFASRQARRAQAR